MKVMTILGTRPEVIRLSRVIHLLEQTVDHVLVHTGQNSDYELNKVFFDDLGLRKPDVMLGVDCSSPASIIGGVLLGTEKALREHQPDAVLILGDTNSCLAGLIVRRMKIPLYHMEAGNRCFDLNVPEENNRRVIDHVSDINLVYTEHARRNLLAEGVPCSRIYLTGSPMFEVLHAFRSQIDASSIVSELGLEKGKYFIASLHRAENVDLSARLDGLLTMLNDLAESYAYPIIVSTHPRTRQRLEQVASVTPDSRIRFEKPFGYHDYVRLQIDSACAISDSGTISEEAAILGFPAVTPRISIERPEAMDSGHIIACGLDPESILSSVKFAMEYRNHLKTDTIPAEYQVPNTSHRVLRIILGTARTVHNWQGIVSE